MNDSHVPQATRIRSPEVEQKTKKTSIFSSKGLAVRETEVLTCFRHEPANTQYLDFYCLYP